MSIFGSILHKIVSFAEGSSQAAPASASSAPATGGSPSTASTASSSAETSTSDLSSVDVGSVLAAKASEKGGNLNWQTSIVDLLKVLDLDSSLSARKELASELDVHEGADGSAEENIALHKAVVAKLEANGGKLPAEMKA